MPAERVAGRRRVSAYNDGDFIPRGVAAADGYQSVGRRLYKA